MRRKPAVWSILATGIDSYANRAAQRHLALGGGCTRVAPDPSSDRPSSAAGDGCRPGEREFRCLDASPLARRGVLATPGADRGIRDRRALARDPRDHRRGEVGAPASALAAAPVSAARRERLTFPFGATSVTMTVISSPTFSTSSTRLMRIAGSSDSSEI